MQLPRNFQGEEKLRQRIINYTPFFGNDDEIADEIAVRVYNDLLAAIDGKPNTKGEAFHLNMLSTTCHVYFERFWEPRPTAVFPVNPFPMELRHRTVAIHKGQQMLSVRLVNSIR